MGGSNKLIKILTAGGRFGFVEPLPFDSVMSLVHHYRNNSLSHYNRTLDTKLLYPIRKPKVDSISNNSYRCFTILLL